MVPSLSPQWYSSINVVDYDTLYKLTYNIALTICYSMVQPCNLEGVVHREHGIERLIFPFYRFMWQFTSGDE